MVNLIVMRGTLILMFNTSHGLYMSADSRLTNTAEPKRNGTQKLFRCGKWAACGVSGNLGLDVTTTHNGFKSTHSLDITAVLAKASAAIPELNAEDQVQFLIGELYAPLKEHWRLTMHNKALADPMNPTNNPDESNVFTLLFAKREPGTRARILQVHFPFEEVPRLNGGWANSLLAPKVTDLGDSASQGQGLIACLEPISNPEQIRSRTAITKTINGIYSTASHKTAVCKEQIGGPIDIAVIDDEGFRWLQTKDR